MTVLNIIGAVVAAALATPCVIFFIECMAALFARRNAGAPAEGQCPTVAVLIPAHNEALVICQTIEHLQPQLRPTDRLLVIADNCSDCTATVARDAGAQVLQRHDLERRGKGHALAFGLRHLQADPPEVVLFVDADCRVGPEALPILARRAQQTGRPVQAAYLMELPADPSPRDAMSMLAFTVKNLVRPTGMARLGGPCHLTGTGMAAPWHVIRDAPLESSNIVEDMQLGLDLALCGHPPLFCAAAGVTSRLPGKRAAATTQRTRWEHGHLQTLLTQGPRLLLGAVKQRRIDLLALGMDLCVPPLSLLVTMLVTALAGMVVAASLGGSWWPALTMAAALGLLILAVLTAWFKYAPAQLPWMSLLAIPFYVTSKAPIYLRFFMRRQKQWVRTERDG